MKNQSLSQQRVLAATSISYIVVILDTSIVNVALERISNALHTHISGLQWVVNAYTLAFACLLLSGGTLGDRWGARNIYLAGLALFTAASALCGFAPDLTILTIARVLQGVGAALLVPCSLTLINHAYPDPGERAVAFGVWASCGGAAMAAGPLVGGLLINMFGWRSIFLANVPIGLLGVWLIWRVARDKSETQIRHLDLSGQLSLIVALGSLITVLIEGPVLGWQSLPILIGIAVSIVSAGLFLMIESLRDQPMLPLSFFGNGLFSGSVVVTMVSALIFYGLVFMLSLYFQQVRNYSALQTGLSFLPLTAMVTFGSMISSRLTKKYGPRWPVAVALGLYATGFFGLLPVTATSPYWMIALPLPVIGLAAGLITPAATTALMGTVEKSRAGVAAGVQNASRQTGASIGVAIFGALSVAIHPFNASMHTAMWIAAVISLAALLIWWLTAISNHR
ncbi:MFS transporter [Verminephrobacter eiseniae]|uniref:MFS transporter n=1 Tax=Verminephrobacter eiseniae TaxID=364317 RepID=UPI0010D0EF52|nr:MFS transporter [Verminephrobacter eiseniae]KAB7597777.1 MFS transporter [Verminephrobacter sp. Larva24]MCW5230282.1 DHA2 family efflux MFS transporter permease subunit [Verminephrobacter eiseniae]MCW5292016.1 DHA2 family efflux MFS transporter permease subunit [Verminephrobacter eiseniae]MCW8185768.1 DHA2 family efflux MFS transporter permease subunit [Verminephrobacter eiseniae]MCW8225307.1 DHA2 family efflux MFS transporter permease subunit [Verminephrobacter eiseniae]